MINKINKTPYLSTRGGLRTLRAVAAAGVVATACTATNFVYIAQNEVQLSEVVNPRNQQVGRIVEELAGQALANDRIEVFRSDSPNIENRILESTCRLGNRSIYGAVIFGFKSSNDVLEAGDVRTMIIDKHDQAQGYWSSVIIAEKHGLNWGLELIDDEHEWKYNLPRNSFDDEVLENRELSDDQFKDVISGIKIQYADIANKRGCAEQTRIE